jgi:hypothetical protein
MFVTVWFITLCTYFLSTGTQTNDYWRRFYSYTLNIIIIVIIILFYFIFMIIYVDTLYLLNMALMYSCYESTLTRI